MRNHPQEIQGNKQKHENTSLKNLQIKTPLKNETK